MSDTPSFVLELTGDVEAAVERARAASERNGSTFHGDRFAGMFRGMGIEGYYRVDGQKVLVTVSEKPAMLPMSVVENAFRNYFGVDQVPDSDGADTGDAGEPAAAGDSHDDDAKRKRRPILRPRAKELVKKHALYASGAGLVPVPMADIAAVSAVQLKMLIELTDLYEVAYTRSALREFATALTGSTAARLGASALKAIPGIGTLVGGASMSILSGASTYAVGVVTIDELEAGREIGSSSADRVKRAYLEALEEGKEIIEKLKGEPPDDGDDDPQP